MSLLNSPFDLAREAALDDLLPTTRDQKAIDRDHPQPIEHRPRLGEPGVDQSDPVAKRLKGETRRLERVGVAVDPDQLPVRGRALQHRARMSAKTHGRVAVPSRGLGVEPGEHLVQ